MKFELTTKEVGPYSMNTYAVIDKETKTSAIVDPGGDPDIIMGMVRGTKVDKIFLTHGHSDHVLALEEIKEKTGAEVYIHPKDAAVFNLAYDCGLKNGDNISLGNHNVSIIHVPGHTPGLCCIDLGDGRIIVGDAIFVGGPGRTASPEDFSKTMESMKEIVFKWPDKTRFFPGHGPSGLIGNERSAFENYYARGWSPETCGDVNWE